MEGSADRDHRQPEGPGWESLRPVDGTPWGATARHFAPEAPPTSRLTQFLADGMGYALASFVLGVLSLVWAYTGSGGLDLVVGVVLIASTVRCGNKAYNASIRTPLAWAGTALAGLAVVLCIAHNPGAVVGYW